jgi:hypothetical protein
MSRGIPAIARAIALAAALVLAMAVTAAAVTWAANPPELDF